jgi:hypothetical protein
MNRYVEVFWTPFVVNPSDSPLLYLKPKPFFPILAEARKGADYLKCPALVDSFQNDFVICAPYDLNVICESKTKSVFIDRFDQNFFNDNITNRWGVSNEELPPLIHMPPRYLFYSFDNVSIELADLPIIKSDFSSNAKIIRASYNISKWYRSTEVAFEVIDSSKPVTLKAEQPMCLVRFQTPNNVPVKLTRVEFTPELEQRASACMKFKTRRPNMKLDKLYELAAEFIQLFKSTKDKK